MENLPEKIDPYLNFLRESGFDKDHFAMMAAKAVAESRNAMSMLAVSCFRAGALLIVAKNSLKKDNWGAFLHEVGVSDRSAQEYMLAARRAQSKGVLSEKLAQLGWTKAQAVLALPEPELKRMLDGGKVGDLDTDRAEHMTVRELRDEVRKLLGREAKLKKKLDVGAKQLAARGDRIALLEGEHSKRILGPLNALLLRTLQEAAKLANYMPTPEEGAEFYFMVTGIQKNIGTAEGKFAAARREFDPTLDKVRHIVPDMAKLEEDIGQYDPGEEYVKDGTVSRPE